MGHVPTTNLMQCVCVFVCAWKSFRLKNESNELAGAAAKYSSKSQSIKKENIQLIDNKKSNIQSYNNLTKMVRT